MHPDYDENHEKVDGDPTSHHVRRALKGDREGLGWVVARFSPLLKAQAAYRLGTRAGQVDAEDIVSEAWLVALRRLGTVLNGEGRKTPRLLAFLSTTIVNITNRRLRSFIDAKQVSPGAGRDASRAGIDPMDRQAADISGVVTRALRAELSSEIEAALSSLPRADQDIVILRGIEGFTNKEAAEELQDSANSVSQRYVRALRKLRERMPDSIFTEFVEE